MRNKSIDLEKIAQGLDISPTMYKYAVERYNGIARFLETKGIKAHFYPQGSFRTGTVTRPIKNGVESDFDIDVICLLTYDKNKITPQKVKMMVGEALKEDETYRKKLLPEDDRCWTLEYAELVSDIGLKLDVVPAVKEEMACISRLMGLSVNYEYACQAIAITNKEIIRYSWVSSNPAGFGNWFDKINEKYISIDLYEKKRQILTENRALFEANMRIEDVPNHYVHSSLQRVIQLLKRHRDLFFYRNNQSYRPSSVIITSLAAKIAGEVDPMNTEKLLEYIIDGLDDYATLLSGESPKARYYGEIRELIKKSNGKWYIPNPVDPEDNYADSWTDEHAKAFFAWVEAVKRDLSSPTVINEARYITGLQTSFGKTTVEKILGVNVTSGDNSTCIAEEISHPTKPWGCE